VAAGIFVAVDPRHGKALAPKLRDVFEGLRTDFIKHACIDPDIGDADATAVHPARQQQMRRLAAEERDGLGGAHRDAHDGASAAVDAARQINAENRCAVGVDRLDHLERIALHRPIEPGTEQRIDDQRRPADRLGIARQHRIFPSSRRRGRVALQTIPLTQQDDRDLAAARRELSRRHEAIAAIVAAAGDHQDRPLLHEVDRRLRNGLTRAQHQREARRPRGNGQPIGTLHLSSLKNFHAEFPIPAPYPEAFTICR
jgi:hypothetical protein